MNLKALALLPLFIQSMIGYTQEKKLEYSVDYSFGQSFRSIENTPSVASYRTNEVPTVVHGVNFQIKYRLKERLGIVSGIGYNQYGEEVEFANLTFGYMIDPRIGFTNGSLSVQDPASVKFKYIYNFLSVPLLLNYSIIHRETSDLDIQIGGSMNYLIDSKVVTITKYQNGDKKRNADDYSFKSNDVNFAGVFGLFYKRKIGSKYFIKIGPQVDYFFTSISDSGINQFPYKYSINIGFGF